MRDTIMDPATAGRYMETNADEVTDEIIRWSIDFDTTLEQDGRSYVPELTLLECDVCGEPVGPFYELEPCEELLTVTTCSFKCDEIHDMAVAEESMRESMTMYATDPNCKYCTETIDIDQSMDTPAYAMHGYCSSDCSEDARDAHLLMLREEWLRSWTDGS